MNSESNYFLVVKTLSLNLLHVICMDLVSDFTGYEAPNLFDISKLFFANFSYLSIHQISHNQTIILLPSCVKFGI